MSHMLEKLEDGSYAMAYAGEKCWHGLGTHVADNLTPKQMLKAAKLDWTTKLVPTYYSYKGEQQLSGDKALIRESDGRLLTVVSDNWSPVQNLEAAEFFDEYVKEAAAS